MDEKMKIKGHNIYELLSQMKDISDERKGEFKTYVEMFRWDNNFPLAVKTIAYKEDIIIQIDEQKHFFRKTLFIRGKGTNKKLFDFLCKLEIFIDLNYPEAEDI